jgi:hypothetical protein
LQVDVFGLVRGKWSTLTMKEDPTPTDRWDLERGGAEAILLNVPEGARRVAAEVTSAEAKDVDLFLGFDSNNDRKVQQTELLATSLSDGWHELVEVADDNLREGRYWVLVQNFAGSEGGQDKIALSTGIVPGEDAGNLTVTAPPRVTAGTPFALDVGWKVSNMVRGDRWFGVLELRSRGGPVAEFGRIMVDIAGPPEPTPTPTGPTPTPPPTPTATRTRVPTATRTPTVIPIDTPATPTTAVPTLVGPTPERPTHALFLPRTLQGVR